MKVEIKQTNKPVKPNYPYLGQNDEGYIVWFSSRGRGILIADVVTVANQWVESEFHPFEGEVILSND